MSVAEPLPYDALAELRGEIAEAAIHPDPVIAEARLRELRVDVIDLLGDIDQRIGDQEEAKRGTEELQETPVEVLRLRENADVREHILREGWSDADELDEVFLYSHDTLDELAEEGLLEEAGRTVAGIMSAAQLGNRMFVEREHPRGRGGKWTDKLGGSVAGGKAALSELRSKKKTSAGRVGRAKAAASTARRGREKGLPAEEKGARYQARRTKLEERTAKVAEQAAAGGKLSDAEAHFNDAGKVSQRTLATYVDQAKTKPQTIDLYSQVNSNGERVWDESRRQVHDRIISAYLKKRRIDEESGKPVLDFSPEAEDLQPHPDGPRVLFSGGGYAAGKGGVLKLLGAQGELPPDSFTLDPDQVKAELPEFAAMIGTDPEANMHVYQEAWAISQEIQAQAQERKLNITVDGISNTSPDEMIERAKSFTDKGYTARAVYVDIPTEEAIKRATKRAVTAKDDSDRRMIPEIIMRSVHRDVAATVPSLLTVLQNRDDVSLDLEVWDNHQGADENGQFRPPKQFVTFVDGQMEVVDQALWDSFVQKGHETILHVDAAPNAGESERALPGEGEEK